MTQQRNLNWIPVVELAVLAFTSLGVTIGLFIHSDIKFHNSMIESEKRSDRILEGIRQDILSYHKETCDLMRDFHGRLCAIEERNKK